MKVKDAIQPFLDWGRVERMHAAETRQHFRSCLRTWIVPHLGECDLASISALHILAFRKAIADRRLSIPRQYSLLVVLKQLLKFTRTVLGIDCLDPSEVRLPRRPQRPVDFLTNEEIGKLLGVLPTHTYPGLRMRVLIEVLLSTGMRISEALSLNRNSINFECGEAEIVGKGGKQRIVFFSPSCLNWIQQYLAQRRDENPALFVTTGESPSRLKRDDMSKFFTRLRELSGIGKRLCPHLLRHTFCTRLLHNGADITFIKELAGHQDIETTARYYLGVDKQSLRSVLKRCRAYGWESATSAQPRAEPVAHTSGGAG